MSCVSVLSLPISHPSLFLVFSFFFSPSHFCFPPVSSSVRIVPSFLSHSFFLVFFFSSISSTFLLVFIFLFSFSSLPPFSSVFSSFFPSSSFPISPFLYSSFLPFSCSSLPFPDSFHPFYLLVFLLFSLLFFLSSPSFLILSFFLTFMFLFLPFSPSHPPSLSFPFFNNLYLMTCRACVLWWQCEIGVKFV